MKTTITLLAAFGIGVGVSLVHADDEARFPSDATFTTRALTPFAIEGLTGDAAGNLYTTGRDLTPGTCPVWRVTGSTLTVVGFIPNPPNAQNTGTCNPSGITFDAFGNLYIADGGAAATVWKLAPDATTPPLATAFATGVPGTNGLAFDRDGNLWTGDGTQNQGRVWKIAPTGGMCEPAFSGCVEAFRVQPMANDKLVGRSNSTLQPNGSANPQGLVANGIVFNHEGDMFIADTARGAIWKVEFDRHGNLRSPTGCDSTFKENTLCLDNIWVAHPILEGADGIAMDSAENIWVAANERNAIAVVTRERRGVVEIFRNPVNDNNQDPNVGLRNSASPAVGNNHILELPTSPFLLGKQFCTANSDGNRRDNSPRNAGEIDGGGAIGARGKISCMDQNLKIPGLPLPVR